MEMKTVERQERRRDMLKMIIVSVLAILGPVSAPAALAQTLDDHDAAMSRCAAEFRSFDPETGTYTDYDGETVLCPYLGQEPSGDD